VRNARMALLHNICAQCAHASHLGPSGPDITCTAWACPVFYERVDASREVRGKHTTVLQTIVRDAIGGSSSTLDW
jgi:hypothetical protein